jgi:acyl-CoA hydrolase
VGKTTMIVGMRVETFNPRTSKSAHTNSCYFTMAAKNDDGTLKEVPELLLSTPKEIIRFCEGKLIKTMSREKREVLKSDMSHLTNDELVHQCAQERCTIKLTLNN